jgi:5-hydroxyisourate hydrolase-like protein (transthyretin family)
MSVPERGVPLGPRSPLGGNLLVRSRLLAGVVTIGVASALLTVPAATASAAPLTVTVGPEALLDGSTGIRLTKEYETNSPVAGVRSTADHVYVEGPTDTLANAAHGGSSLQLFTGAGTGVSPTYHGKDYVGRWFDATPTDPTALSAISYRTLTPNAGLAPYLNVELYSPTGAGTPTYVNSIWTPGVGPNPAVVTGVWQDYDTGNAGWSTTSNSIGLVRNSAQYTLAQIVSAATSLNPDLELLRVNVVWGDTAGGYANKSAYLDDLALTLDGDTTTYSFDAPYTTPCTAPNSGWVRASELADPTQWAVHTEYQPTVTSSATASLVSGPTGATGGQSLQLASGPGTPPSLALPRGYAGKVFVDRVLPGCTISDVTSLSYRAFTASTQGGLAPYLNIDVALPGSNAGAGPSSILVWSPNEGGNPAPTANAWTIYTPTTGSGWRVTRAITGAGTLTPGTYYSWAQVKAAIPGAEMPRGVQLVVGDSTYQAVAGTGWSGKTLQVDSLAIGINGTVSTSDFGGPFGDCLVDLDYGARTITLLADCETSGTLFVPDGWTVDGDGHSIIGMETPSTAFSGAILQNSGVLMSLRDLTVTTNKAIWDNPAKNSGGDLVGIRFLNASGSMTDVTVDGVSHGNGVQEGKGVLVDNRTNTHSVQVTADRITVVNYQKNGVDVRGSGATLELRDSVIGFGATPNGVRIDDKTASNSLVVAYGATAVVTGNHIAGNDWDGAGDTTNTRDWSASGILLYQAGGTVISRNVVEGAGTDNGVYSYQSAATITCNLVTRTADQPGRLDVWSTGIVVDGGTGSLAGNTVRGFRTPINGAVQSGTGGCPPAAPSVTATGGTSSTGTVSWADSAPQDFAPVSGWEVVVDGTAGTLDADVLTLPVSGLAPASRHDVAVRALNADGAGPWSSTTFTTPDIDRRVPAAPAVASSVGSPRTASVLWSAEGGILVTSWEVSVDGTVRTLPAGTTDLDLTGLDPASHHQVSVRGVNDNGTGPWTATSFTTTAIPLPGTVTGLVASSITRTTASVGWDPSSVVGDGAVDKYEVAVDGAPAIVASGTTSRSLSGLLPGTAHTVVVRAHNESGWGDPVSVSFTTNDLDRRTPGAPTLVVGDPDIDGIIPVSWTPNAGDSTDFPVTSWVVTVDGADEASLPAASTSYDVVGLADGRHTISVRGVNALGSSAFAAQVIVVESQNAILPTAELSAAPATVRPGGSTTLTSVFGLDGLPASDAVVTLWRKAGSAWVLVSTTVADEDGVATFVVKPGTTTRYRAVTAGLPSAYATVTVSTKAAPVVAAKVTKKRAGALTSVKVKVTVSPRPTGATISLQRKSGSSWRTVSTAKVGSTATVKLKAGKVRVLKKGTYRVVVSATASTNGAVSKTFTIKVKRR